MNSITLHELWTVIALIVFLGIVIWAMSSKRKSDFDQAAQLALDDDQSLQATTTPASKTEQPHQVADTHNN